MISNFHNPINENSIFEIEKIKKTSKISIFNSLGKKIHSQNSFSKIEIGKVIEDRGIYYLVLYDMENKISYIKLQRE